MTRTIESAIFRIVADDSTLAGLYGGIQPIVRRTRRSLGAKLANAIARSLRRSLTQVAAALDIRDQVLGGWNAIRVDSPKGRPHLGADEDTAYRGGGCVPNAFVWVCCAEQSQTRSRILQGTHSTESCCAGQGWLAPSCRRG